MKEPQLPEKIIAFIGLLPSTLFVFGSSFLIIHELSEKTIKEINILFWIALILISSSFLCWFFSLIKEFIRIVWYRWKYSIKRLNKDFFLVSFNGSTVCLLDELRKEIRWIKNWQTALDLDFVGEWTNVKRDVTKPSGLSSPKEFKTKDGRAFKLVDFKYVNGIYTRGTPGT